MSDGFLRRYFDSFETIEGWFLQDAALLFIACNQLVREYGIAGDALEIGVHHGLSAILTASLRGEGRRFYAVDLFEELQDQNSSGSGAGARVPFMRNMQRFFDDLSFMEVIAGSSARLSPAELGARFSFCHIDGGHSARETYQDLQLCYQVVMAGGLVVLDDYFNANWPGVGEGSIRYHLDFPKHFVPVAVGYNKVVLQKAPASFDPHATLAEVFADTPKQVIDFWDTPTFLFLTDLRKHFDVDLSSPYRLVSRLWVPIAVRMESTMSTARAQPGAVVTVPVCITSESTQPINWDAGMVCVSYHVRNNAGRYVWWDNPRTYFSAPLQPGRAITLEVPVAAPAGPGIYSVEIDIVREGVAWLSSQGMRPHRFELTVAD